MKRINITDEQYELMASLYNYRGLPNRWKILDRVFDIRLGDIILDCGAFHGDMSLYFSKKVGRNGKIYSIEAHPDNVDVLKYNIKRYRLYNVDVIDKALSDKKKKIQFYISNYINSCSILSDFRKVDKKKSIEVESITIDSLNLDKVDYIWMNIEGAELNALKGAQTTLRDNDCKILISTHKITEDYYITDDVIKILESYEYKTETLEDKPTWVYAEK